MKTNSRVYFSLCLFLAISGRSRKLNTREKFPMYGIYFMWSHIDTSTTFCPLITQTLRIISVRCIPLSLRSKTRRRATLLLPTWICSCQSVGTVIFTLPFTTNVTISISILQTFRFWVATSHLRPPMAFLSHNSSDTPGLAPLMNVLFWGRCDFPISFSGRDMSRNVWNRL